MTFQSAKLEQDALILDDSIQDSLEKGDENFNCINYTMQCNFIIQCNPHNLKLTSLSNSSLKHKITFPPFALFLLLSPHVTSNHLLVYVRQVCACCGRYFCISAFVGYAIKPGIV
jgi:hypothetical protein